MYICYLVTNNVNQKKYVGITRNTLAVRWKRHYYKAMSGGGYALHRAIRKYGADKFDHVTLCKNITKEAIDMVEQQMIVAHNTRCGIGHGYNMTEGGEGRKDGKRRPLTEEHKRKLSESNKGKHGKGEKRNPDHVERAASVRRLNTKPTHTTPHTTETKQRLSEINKGKKLSEETKHRMSVARKGKKQSAETIAKRIGQKRSVEAKRKMSESKRKRDAIKRNNNEA